MQELKKIAASPPYCRSPQRTIHILKTKSPYFEALRTGAKTFEIREYRAQEDGKIARNFQVGDVLRLIEKDGARTIDKLVSYILRDTDYPEGIPDGFVVMGLVDVPKLEWSDVV